MSADFFIQSKCIHFGEDRVFVSYRRLDGHVYAENLISSLSEQVAPRADIQDTDASRWLRERHFRRLRLMYVSPRRTTKGSAPCVSRRISRQSP
jgi:hypothetical protein